MKLTCPKCRSKIPPGEVNVATDLAKCVHCQEILKASLLVEETEVPTPPAGSAIRVQGEPETGISAALPAGRFSLGLVFPFLFCLFWLVFISFWTFVAASQGGPFAFVSIPFWIVGVGMAGSLLNSVLERQILEVGPDGLRIRKARPFFARDFTVPYGEISKIAVERVLARDPFTAVRGIRHFPWNAWAGFRNAVVTHGTRKTPVGEHLSEPEMEWLVRWLGAWVGRAAGRRVTAPGSEA